MFVSTQMYSMCPVYVENKAHEEKAADRHIQRECAGSFLNSVSDSLS